jgi:DNA-binding transcriptional ArsR family regulator
MSPTSRLRRALADRAAAQWIALGVALAGSEDESVVDLEALITLTAEVCDDDPRVREGAIDWCAAYGEAVHAGRMRVIAAEMGVPADDLGPFAAQVADAGGPRWPVATQPAYRYRARGKVQVRDLRAPARLIWRLRSAFGVNARADILAVLLTQTDRDITLADLARATRFTKRNVTVTIRSLQLAGLVETERVGNAQRVRLSRDSVLRPWLCPVAQNSRLDWPARFAVALEALRFASAERTTAPVVRAVDARALVERLSPAIRRLGLHEPDTAALGEAFDGAFDRWLDELAADLGPHP